MRPSFDPLRLMLISVAGWLSQQQRDVIDYLQEENRLLRQQLGNKRLRLDLPPLFLPVITRETRAK